MAEKEIIDAMKEMFAEERKHTDSRFAEERKHTDSRFAEERKHTDSRFAEERKYMGNRFAEEQKHMDSRFTEERKSTDAKIETTKDKTVQQIKVLLENGDEKKIKILAEGYKQILDRLPQAEEQREIKSRVTTLEHVVSDHSQRIKKLEKA